MIVDNLTDSRVHAAFQVAFQVTSTNDNILLFVNIKMESFSADSTFQNISHSGISSFVDCSKLLKFIFLDDFKICRKIE